MPDGAPFQTLEDQKRHYAETRRRLIGAGDRYKEETTPEYIARIKAQKAAEAKRRMEELMAKYRAVEIATPASRRRLVCEEVCKKHKIPVAEVLGKSRTAPIIRARQEVMYELCMRFPTVPIAEIGRFLKRDHTTVLHGIKQHAQRNNLPIMKSRPGSHGGRMWQEQEFRP